MRPQFISIILVSAVLASSVPAMAQPIRDVAQTGPAVTERAPSARSPSPLFYLFGIPVVVSAPVPPAYCACAYTNVGGQFAEAAAATGVLSRIGD